METLNLVIGKVYSPERIIKEIEKFGKNSRIQIGHAYVKYNKTSSKPEHLYHLDIDKLKRLIELAELKERKFSEKLKEKVVKEKPSKKSKTSKTEEIPLEIHIKVLSIVNPCRQNFAYKLLMSDEIQKWLKESKKTKQGFLIEENDLDKHECKSSMGNATKCLNCVMSKNDLEEFKATKFVSREDKKHYIKISYQGTVDKKEIECEVE